MQWKPTNRQCGLLIVLTVAGALLLLPKANAASCTTESQMTAAQRDAVSKAARSMINDVQSGDVQALRANTIPAVASDFGDIAAAAASLKPLVQHATITVDSLYGLDASSEPAGAAHTEFFCGAPLVVFNFNNLPPAKYGLAILHATGVPKPQQIALVLSETAENQWMLAGFFSRPMIEAGHNGLWYWEQAREYAQKKMDWNAWFYYQTAAPLLVPVEFLSSPNLEKLRQEADAIRPAALPGSKPMMLEANGSTFAVSAIAVTTEFGGLDLEVHYVPDSTQAAQLRDPVAAGKQVRDLMSALLALHPELRTAFHGIWVHADQGDTSIYALELPMNEISTHPVNQPR